MDAKRFDNLLRSLVASLSRRGISRALASLALAGPLSTLFGPENAEAKKKKRKKKKKKCKGGTKKCGKRCIPETSCCTSADCGSGGTCAGGDCTCRTGFKSCQGTCIPDDACCSADCGPCESCQGAACVFICQAEQECVSGQCRCTANSCDGCCDGNTCQDGDTTAFCGSDGETCDTCVGSEICQGGACVCLTQCCSDDACNPGQLCAQGQCVTGQGTCAMGADFCVSEASCNGPECVCTSTTAGQTRCAKGPVLAPCNSCLSDADCAMLSGVPGAFCARVVGPLCPSGCTNYCIGPCPQ
jgi:hypothetical protein